MLYSRIFKNKKLMRRNPEEAEKARQRVESGRYSIFDVDEECGSVCGV